MFSFKSRIRILTESGLLWERKLLKGSCSSNSSSTWECSSKTLYWLVDTISSTRGTKDNHPLKPLAFPWAASLIVPLQNRVGGVGRRKEKGRWGKELVLAQSNLLLVKQCWLLVLVASYKWTLEAGNWSGCLSVNNFRASHTNKNQLFNHLF